MASVVIIIRVPVEAPKDNHPSGKKSTNTDTESKEELIGEQASENVQKHTAIDQERQPPEAWPEGTKINKSVTEPDSPQSITEEHLVISPQSAVELLQNVLEFLKVQGVSWQITKDQQFYQVMFIEDAGDRVEKILNMLTGAGIGLILKSSVSVIPTSVHIQSRKPVDASSNENGETTEEETQSLLPKDKESTKDLFLKSVKSKLTVQQVVEGVKTQAQLTFDYVMFTTLASLIAAVGLVEDNSVVLVASMLVSPLMGPILGGTFGTVIKNKELRNIGLKTEICGLTISVFVGFLFGFICGPFGLDGASWNPNIDSWPTMEMSSRGMLRSLWVGTLIALPSGAGVALSVLGGNAGSLVGVAISASLLPPAVNSGMLWSYAIISSIKHPEINESQNTGPLGCPALKDNKYLPMYNCHMGKEAAIMAIISFVLTIVNIICILITGTLVLKLKEVTPRASSSNATQTFWTKDVKVARQAYQTFKGDEATNFKNTFLKEWKRLSVPNQESLNTLQKETEFARIIKEVEDDETYQTVVGKAPHGGQYMHQYSKELEQQIPVDDSIDEHAMAVQHLQTIHNQYSKPTADQPRHVGTVFQSTPEQKPKAGRTFVVTETGNPHLRSLVRVRPPTETSEKYSVRTESGV